MRDCLTTKGIDSNPGKEYRDFVHNFTWRVSVAETNRAFLSARVPSALRNRFKAVAARRGLKMQDLLQRVVEDYVDREELSAPRRAAVMNKLRRHRDQLEARGVRHLILFGSVARGDARADSDIDLAVEFEGDKAPSLITLGILADEIEAMLGGQHKVDLVPLKQMRNTVSKAARKDAIEVL